MQEQLSKIMSENDNLQKGIKQYSDNEIHLRMIITIYEDKLKRLQEAQESYQRRVSELENTEEVEILKDYFTSERQQLLQEEALVLGSALHHLEQVLLLQTHHPSLLNLRQPLSVLFQVLQISFLQ